MLATLVTSPDAVAYRIASVMARLVPGAFPSTLAIAVIVASIELLLTDSPLDEIIPVMPADTKAYPAALPVVLVPKSLSPMALEVPSAAPIILAVASTVETAKDIELDSPEVLNKYSTDPVTADVLLALPDTLPSAIITDVAELVE